MTATADENLRELLQHMLTPIRRARETPLQFEIDSARIARSALVESLAGVPEETFAQREDWEPVTAALDRLVAQALADETRAAAALPPAGTAPVPGPDNGTAEAATGRDRRHPLATWLDRFFSGMRKVDPRAFEILGRRTEGLRDRDIAAQLDLGLRLVRRIVRDMRSAWATQTKTAKD